MKLNCVLLFLCAFGSIRTEQMTAHEEELFTTDLELDEFDLEDLCEPKIQFEWSKITQQDYNAKEALTSAKTFAESEREKAKKFSGRLNDDSPTREEVTTRKLEMISRPGDVLLPPEKYKKLLLFPEEVQDAIAKKRKDCNSLAINCDLTSRDPAQLLNAWNKLSIVGQTDDIFKQYPRILDLVSDAAKENGSPDAESYWLMLSDLESDGYQQAKKLWEDVKPLYLKFHHWVAGQLQSQYGQKVFQNMDNSGAGTQIPSHLLGSYLGFDWTSIADIVLKDGCKQTYLNIEKTLEEKEFKGKKLYEKAEAMTSYLHLGKLSKAFWSDSEFDRSCPAKSIDPCHSGARVAACNKASWSNYLDAHQIIMTTIHTQLTSASSLSYLQKTGNRYSAVYDAAAGLAPLLASLRHYLAQNGFVSLTDECAFDAVLTLSALRVLPLIPYYLVADLARLEAIKANNTNNIATIWHQLQYDMDMQGISTPEKEWWGFLDDPHVTSNRPYISKFYGVFLQFHLWEALIINDAESFDDVEEFVHSKEEFRTLLTSGMSKKWPRLIEETFKIKKITSAPLLRFFKRFEATLSAIPSKPYATIPRTVTRSPSVTAKGVVGVSVTEANKNDLKVSSQEEEEKNAVTNSTSSSDIFEGLGIGSYLLFSFLVLGGILLLVVIGKFVWRRARRTYHPPTHQNQPA